MYCTTHWPLPSILLLSLFTQCDYILQGVWMMWQGGCPTYFPCVVSCILLRVWFSTNTITRKMPYSLSVQFITPIFLRIGRYYLNGFYYLFHVMPGCLPCAWLGLMHSSLSFWGRRCGAGREWDRPQTFSAFRTWISEVLKSMRSFESACGVLKVAYLSNFYILLHQLHPAQQVVMPMAPPAKLHVMVYQHLIWTRLG